MQEVIHFHLGYIKRSNGGSVVGFAAYCSGEKIYSQYDGRTHLKKRSDVVFKKILLPQNAPEKYLNREVLWNSVEMHENSRGQLARTIDLAFPKELNQEEQKKLILEYIQKNFVDHGMCADVSIHDKNDGNPHAHIILTLRSIDENGSWQAKWKKNYLYDEFGNRIFDFDTSSFKCGPSIPLNDWGNKENAEIWRKEWADACNRMFEYKDLEKRVTHESYARQGVKRKPQKHLGRKVLALEKRGIRTERGNLNREIEENNRLREEKKKRKREKKRSYGRER